MRSRRLLILALPWLMDVCTAQVPTPTGGSSTPAVQTVMIAQGANLDGIAQSVYGNRRFSEFLALVNDIPDPARIQSGSILQTPALAPALKQAGLDARYEKAAEAMAEAWTDYCTLFPAYLKARESSGVARGEFKIPEDSRSKLQEASRKANLAIGILRESSPGNHPPAKIINHLVTATSVMDQLAKGIIDGYGYDYELVGQHFGLAFTHAMAWAKSGSR